MYTCLYSKVQTHIHVCVYIYVYVYVCVYIYIHREDKGFDLLDLSCLKTSCGVTEYREVRFTWAGQRSILYAVLKLYYFFNVPEEAWSCLLGFDGGMGAVTDETTNR